MKMCVTREISLLRVAKFKHFLPLILMVLMTAGNSENNLSELNWPTITKEGKPWTYWWWMGSAVDKQNLTRLLEAYSKAGIGGVHIIPIYGVKGFEAQQIPYLSPKWMEMLEHTVSEARRLDMGVDMTTGTGWPFGGPQVNPADAATKVLLETYSLNAGERLEQSISCQDKSARLQALMAFSDVGSIIDLTAKIDSTNKLNWIAPDGKWSLYAVFVGKTGQQVKRAAPGGAGNVMDYFSTISLKNYLTRFDSAFAGYRGEPVRAFYNDSYEVYGANWTDRLFEEFKARRDYDLRDKLPALAGFGSEEVIARVKCDYRETISDLLLERFTRPWVRWCHDRGSRSRNEAHGSPGNLLDLYAAADIPETEIFGPSCFKIPDLRVDPDFPAHRSKPDPLMLKFASSAAHVTGKKLVSSESCTWLGEHFKVALSQVKPEIDQLFVAGINHVFFHGITYSPTEEEWPGWLFYASTNFGPSNSFWPDLPQLNHYIARCQSFLQSGRPDNDILLYFPIHDIWHNADGLLFQLTVHNLDTWLQGSPFYEASKTLWQCGYTFDYISDRMLEGVKNVEDKLETGGIHYRTVVIPKTSFLPVQTLTKLINLARAGATIVVQGDLPHDVPGFRNLENRRQLLENYLVEIEWGETMKPGILKAPIGNGMFLKGENLDQLFEMIGIARETIVDDGIQFIRRTHDQGHTYFLTNLSDHHTDGWVSLGVMAESVIIFDPQSSKYGLGMARQIKGDTTQVWLQLLPGESCIMQTFTSQMVDATKWNYLQRSGPVHELTGTWNVRFIDGGPKLPAGFTTEKLKSWTELGGSDAKVFAGTARYTLSFEKPGGQSDDWVLQLGRVCESARVTLNEQYMGTLWSHPFQIAVGEALLDGENTLELEVTNLAANRIADLDRRKVPWKKFYDINFVNINYKKFDAADWRPVDSGLLGPIYLVPMEIVKRGE